MNKNNQPIRVVIADDNRFFCEALFDSLQNHDELNVISFFTSIDKLTEYTQHNDLDVLILDINFNGQSSLDFIKNIRLKKEDFKIISLTTLNNNYIKTKALEYGIDSFIGKDSDLSLFKYQIIDCFQNKIDLKREKSSKINIGNLTFTKKKLNILQALYKHSDKKEETLSGILNISKSALKTHKRELFEITDTKNTPELIKFGIQKGLIIP